MFQTLLLEMSFPFFFVVSFCFVVLSSWSFCRETERVSEDSLFDCSSGSFSLFFLFFIFVSSSPLFVVKERDQFKKEEQV